MFDTRWKRLGALTIAALLGAVHPGLAEEELTADDHAQIHQLYARYVQAIDFGDAIGWADTFTPDGSFGDAVTGRDALIAFAERYPRGERRRTSPLVTAHSYSHRPPTAPRAGATP